MPLSTLERQRYDRHLLLPEIGLSGQDRLKSARVLIVGLGGLGCPVALYLAAAGVGTLGLVDGDRVDLSNLQRQVLYSTADIARPKVEAARERLLALNPEIRVIAQARDFNARNALALLEDYDIVVDGTDRIGARYLLNDACVLAGKALVSAAIHRFEGQALTILPGRGPCYRCLFPEPMDAGEVPSCAEAGVLGVLPGLLGTVQATEVVKLITGAGTSLAGRLFVYDALDLATRSFMLEPRADCIACGPAASVRNASDLVALHGQRAAPPEAVPSLDAPALAAMLAAGPMDAPLLVDVREPDEFAAGHIDGAVNLPLAGVPARLVELTFRRAVFVCQSGARSAEACRRARAAGFADVVNLAGGLRRWRAESRPVRGKSRAPGHLND